MESNQRIASHDGVVTDVRRGSVSVRIESVSACASCAAHSRCGFAESKEKILDVPVGSAAGTFNVGDSVTVHIDESRGMLAVWLAYVLPAILLLAVIIGLSLARLPEWAVVLAAFVTLGLYILGLYLRRRKVERHFTLTVSKHSTLNTQHLTLNT